MSSEARVSAAVSIPVMIQDAPVTGTLLSAQFLVRLAKESANIRHLKIEIAQAAAKLREMIRLGSAAIEGPWDGEEGITLYPDMEAGATGSMTGGGFPDGIRRYSMPSMPDAAMRRLRPIGVGFL